MSKKILITGGAGFIGSNYVHHRRNKYPQDKIVVVDKLTYAGNLPNIERLIENKEIKFFHADIADREFIEELFANEKFDAVVNIAAETHVDRSIANPAPFVKSNINGTFTLLTAAKSNGNIRFHQVSTDEVYGDLGLGSTNFFTEQTPIKPNCPYAATKAAADLLVLSFYETYKLPATISRCTNNYGPYQTPEKLIPKFIQKLLNGENVTLHGKGEHIRDWLYVEDHSRAIDMILESKDYGEVYNVGGHNEKSTLQITDIILNFFGYAEDKIEYIEDRLANDFRYAMDPTKIETKLGWTPSIHFEEGFLKTISWYLENKDWFNKTAGKLVLNEDQVQRLHRSLHAKTLTQQKLIKT